jgi:hypothetical protein
LSRTQSSTLTEIAGCTLSMASKAAADSLRARFEAAQKPLLNINSVDAICQAHLLRDARYAVETGDIAFSAAFKRLLLRAIAIGRRRDTLKDTP